MIIYPPIIGNETIAFTPEEIRVPFLQNPAVGISKVAGFSLKIQEYDNSKGFYVTTQNFEYDSAKKTGTAIFDLSELNLIVGSYYKMQLGYLEKEIEKCYAYSTMFLSKVVQTADSVRIEDWEEGKIYGSLRQYVGHYDTNMASEPPYSYCFTIFSENEVFETSGEQIINIDYEKDGKYSFVFKPERELVLQKVYDITLTVKTVNNFQETKKYSIVRAGEISSTFGGKLTATANSEAGSIEVVIENTNHETCVLELIRNKDNSDIWETIEDCVLISNTNSITFIDRFVEQGSSYKYALRQEAGSYYSARAQETAPIRVDFEYLYLEDETRQLAIRFNPKVSSFKTTALEQKTDTIGSRYPHIFRNGIVTYKEIPISGLISYLLDGGEQALRIYSSDNVKTERDYKLALLDWLNNGKPKVFRSPVEGNYVVQIMNVSLSPEDTLGRLLHSFSCTAYEIADFSMKTLKKSGLFSSLLVDENKPQWEWRSFYVQDLSGEYKVRNVRWELKKPTTAQENFIILNGQAIYNYLGELSTPKDEEYILSDVQYTDDNIDTIITFEVMEEVEPIERSINDFERKAYGGQDVMISSLEGVRLVEVYKIRITEKSQAQEEDKYIVFSNGDKVFFASGLDCEYSNLIGELIPIEIGSGLDVIIYGRIEKDVIKGEGVVESEV